MRHRSPSHIGVADQDDRDSADPAGTADPERARDRAVLAKREHGGNQRQKQRRPRRQKPDRPDDDRQQHERRQNPRHRAMQPAAGSWKPELNLRTADREAANRST